MWCLKGAGKRSGAERRKGIGVAGSRGHEEEGFVFVVMRDIAVKEGKEDISG